jgi:hypothetical protein
MRLVTLSIACCLLVVAAGCGRTKLDMSSTIDVPMEGKSYVVDAAKSQQIVKVTGTASGAPVSVYLYLEKNKDTAERDILANKLVSSVIPASVQKTEGEFTLEATVPANEKAVVQIYRATAKAAKVQIHITNK